MASPSNYLREFYKGREDPPSDYMLTKLKKLAMTDGVLIEDSSWLSHEATWQKRVNDILLDATVFHTTEFLKECMLRGLRNVAVEFRDVGLQAKPVEEFIERIPRFAARARHKGSVGALLGRPIYLTWCVMCGQEQLISMLPYKLSFAATAIFWFDKNVTAPNDSEYRGCLAGLCRECTWQCATCKRIASSTYDPLEIKSLKENKECPACNRDNLANIQRPKPTKNALIKLRAFKLS